MKPYTVAIAGSTEHTLMCAQVLQKSPEFQLLWALTPAPKPVGRMQTITENPVQSWSQGNNIQTFLINTRIDDETKAQIQENTAMSGKPDFLLVVDFGYLVPDWLLQLPAIAPLNIHPSELPRWRGSSPGQFVLLYGERTSAVTLMQMNAGLDTGPLIHQEKFVVDSSWTQTEYYNESFRLICPLLAEKIISFAQNGLVKPQATISPTPIARRLKKDDGFIEWKDLTVSKMTDNALIRVARQTTGQTLQEVIIQAIRAFSPWPGVWTVIQTSKGEKRMQIQAAHLDTNKQVVLDQVKIEGQEQASWAQVKNQILDK